MMGHPHLHTKPNLYKCRSVQRSKMFKQNQLILITSRLMEFLLIWGSSPWGWVDGIVDVWRGALYTHAGTHM